MIDKTTMTLSRHTWRELLQLKLDKDCPALEDIIRFLLDNYKQKEVK